jgi:hypothetical protein
MSGGQLEKVARFLETHPGFYPELNGDAEILGFRVGGCFLSVGEMSEFISAQPRFAADEAALLLAAPPPAPTGGRNEKQRRPDRHQDAR